MSERALRGTRLGATSYETDNGIELAPRQEVEYACPRGHAFQVPFSVEAEIPETWECRVCGAAALRVDGERPEEKKGKTPRTHWDMLLERRTVAQLEEVLSERLAVLRSGGIRLTDDTAARRTPAKKSAANGRTASSNGAARSGGTAQPAAKSATKPPVKKTAPTKKATASSKPASPTKAAAKPAAKSAAKPAAKKAAARKG